MNTRIWSSFAGIEVRQRWIDAGGISTRVIEAGNPADPAVFLIHGTSGHAEAYARNIASHAASFHVYAIDMLGHGYTDKPLDSTYEFSDYVAHLHAVLDAEELESASISGESMGGGIAAWFAYLHPERVDRLVCNTGVAPMYTEEVTTRIYELTMAAVRNPTRESVRQRLEFLMRDPADVTEDLIDSRLGIFQLPGMDKVMDRVLQRLVDPESRARNHLTEEHWRSIEVETLVLWTTDDPTAPASVGEQVAGWLPNSRFEVMKDCGHWPQWEDPETFDRLHVGFLREGV